MKQYLRVDVPRVAVCPDHDPPFKLLADTYFERLSVKVADGTTFEVSGVLVRANRGGSKTFIVAILHYINATYKPGCEGIQFGASEAQANRCYEKIEDWCYEHDEHGSRLNDVKPFILDKPKKSETKWRTGGKVEIVAGSEKAVSGPHNQKAGADEVDQMDPPVWNQSRGIAVAKQATGPLPPFMKRFNGMIPPQDIVSSTMNSTRGLMKELLDEYDEDVAKSNLPQFQLVQWCIWETMAEQPHCRGADPKARKARLKELGRDPCELCSCNKVVKGRMEDGSPRTLQKVCGGKAFKSRGWKPYVDLVSSFKRNTPGTWLLQHESREGKDENIYIQDWSLGEFGVRDYNPHPMYGPIYMGVDWGADHPACVLWLQYLTSEVPALDFEFQPIFLAPGGYVLFKEIYVSGLAAGSIAKRVIEIENGYRSQWPGWSVKNRFCDPQGKGDRITFANNGLKSSWPVKTRNKEQMISTVQNLVVDDRFSVDVDGAPMFCEEVEYWQKKPETGKELDKFNHAMAAWRYGISNAEVLEGKGRALLEATAGQKQDPAELAGKKDTRKVVSAHVDAREVDENQLRQYGSIAASGGTQVPVDPQFTVSGVR